MKIESIVLRAPPGSVIDNAVWDAMEVAAKYHVPVTFMFNGTEVRVDLYRELTRATQQWNDDRDKGAK